MKAFSDDFLIFSIFFVTASTALTLPSTTECNETLNSRTGIISSFQNISCEWRILASPDEKIALNITNLNIEKSIGCSLGYVEVQDGLWPNSSSLGTFCGNDTFVPVTSKTNNLLGTFADQTGEFTASYEAICGDDVIYIYNIETFLKSPNYPEEYPRNKKCVWKFITPETRQAVLSFQSFDLEDNSLCLHDYVEIRDGFTKESNLIGVFCGNIMPPNIISSTNLLLVTFVSDTTVRGSGFSATVTHTKYNPCVSINHGCSQKCVNLTNGYECSCNDGYVLDSNGKDCKIICGGNFNATKGTITSPRYPGLYPPNVTCVYEIAGVPEDGIMKLEFKYLNLEGDGSRCDFDSLEIFSVFDTKLKSHGVYCGTKIPNPILSKSGIKVIFKADDSVARNGFVIDFKSDLDLCMINNGNCRHACRNTLKSKQCVCYGYKSSLNNDGFDCENGCKYEISSDSGVITSPNYPSFYPPYADCEWLFTTTPGHRRVIYFQTLSMEEGSSCGFDEVVIYDGNSIYNKTLSTICRDTLPTTIKSSNNELYMTFKSDGSKHYSGFNATYSTICGGIYVANAIDNYIYSHPEYGLSNYKNRTHCEWIIKGDDRYYTSLSFSTFFLEETSNCSADYVEIFGGTNSSAPSVGRFCGENMPADLVGPEYFIQFHADSSISRKGFSIRFRAIPKIKND